MLRTKFGVKNVVNLTKKEDYPTYKKGTESSAAFRKAFKKAKDAGSKTFTFEGRKYTTADKK